MDSINTLSETGIQQGETKGNYKKPYRVNTQQITLSL